MLIEDASSRAAAKQDRPARLDQAKGLGWQPLAAASRTVALVHRHTEAQRAADRCRPRPPRSRRHTAPTEARPGTRRPSPWEESTHSDGSRTAATPDTW